MDITIYNIHISMYIYIYVLHKHMDNQTGRYKEDGIGTIPRSTLI